jgi:hypothetical protein
MVEVDAFRQYNGWTSGVCTCNVDHPCFALRLEVQFECGHVVGVWMGNKCGRAVGVWMGNECGHIAGVWMGNECGHIAGVWMGIGRWVIGVGGTLC